MAKFNINQIVYEHEFEKFVDEKYSNIIKASSSMLFGKNPKEIINENSDIKMLIVKFLILHQYDLLDEISDGKFDWNNENTKTFYSLMKDKYKVSNKSLTFLLFYFSEYISFIEFNDAMSLKKYTDKDEFFNRSVRFDYSKSEYKRTNDFFIKKYLKDNKLKLHFAKLFLTNYYDIAKKKIEQDKLESDLKTKDKADHKTISEKLKLMTREDFFKEAKEHNLDINVDNYIIEGMDYNRDSIFDRRYRNSFSYPLIEIFGTKCAKCDTFTLELELDHFWLAKSQGGNFIMRHKNGNYVNNAIPLCRSCNSSKGNKSFLEFFEKDEIEPMIEKSQKMNDYINAHMI